eukprot:CAMPEP_0178733784 /NCGR_PEP_ID=MMETSP0744-20121128/980_1 /TAXON_ID=913974 /ORGANISM="Nitzschia punctata, Strain CCMP561" /LENGTH=209 /DNA_ID=CAMNT_0020385991 /DNA_START=51 /DNA_END=680 /DNA_ORIENTATION=-
MKEVVSALKSTVTSLNNVANTLSQQNSPASASNSQQGTSPSSKEEEQPLDSLVFDVLKKQDDNIVELEGSVEGLRDVQEQSSGLIQLVSQNQMQMAEMMATVQSELVSLKAEISESKQESDYMKDRIETLENVLAQYKSNNMTTSASASLSALSHQHSNTDKKKSVVIEPNPIGLGMSMFTPSKQAGSDEEGSEDVPKSRNLENKRRPV